MAGQATDARAQLSDARAHTPPQTIHDRENTIHAKFRDGRIPDATITASTKTVKRMVSKNGKGII